VVILIVGLVKLGGWGELQAICSQNVTPYGDSMMNMIRSAKDPEFPWTGVLLGSAIIGFWYWCTDQYIVQRTLSAHNQKQARRGTVFAGYMKLLPVFIFLVPGMIAYALHQKGIINLERPDKAFPVLVATLLPVGVKGIVVGGLVAALMSSLASLFNSTATLFTVDFYKKFRPDSSERHLVFVGRVATATVVLLGLVWIPVMSLIADYLYRYLQDVQSVIAPSIAVVFILGVFWKRTTPAGGLWGLVIGFILGMFRLVLLIFKGRLSEGTLLYWLADINWLHFCISLFFLSIGIGIVISLFTKKPSEEKIQGLTYGAATPEQIKETRQSWNKWDVIHSLIIVGIIVACYIYFW